MLVIYNVSVTLGPFLIFNFNDSCILLEILDTIDINSIRVDKSSMFKDIGLNCRVY